NDRLQYARTEGVADYRVVFASPLTAATMCGDFVPREFTGTATPEPTAEAGAGGEVAAASTLTPGPTPTVSPSPSPSEATCEERGMIVISIYDWAAGLERFASARSDSRAYLLMHEMGLLKDNPVDECTSGRASVMVDQRSLPET